MNLLRLEHYEFKQCVSEFEQLPRHIVDLHHDRIRDLVRIILDASPLGDLLDVLSDPGPISLQYKSLVSSVLVEGLGLLTLLWLVHDVSQEGLCTGGALTTFLHVGFGDRDRRLEGHLGVFIIISKVTFGSVAQRVTGTTVAKGFRVTMQFDQSRLSFI